VARTNCPALVVIRESADLQGFAVPTHSDPETHLRPHSLKVRLNRDDLWVDARSTAYTAAASPNLSTPETLHAAINSPLRETAIPLEITSYFVPSGDGKGEIKLVIKVGVGEADLVNIDEVTKAEFDLAVRITGPDGKLSPPSIHQLKWKQRQKQEIRQCRTA